MSPSSSLTRFHQQAMMRLWPFSSMDEQHVRLLAMGLRETYHPAGERILQRGQTAPERLAWLRRGEVHGWLAERGERPTFVREAGELFPVAAFLDRRALRADYEAATDCFVAWLDGAQVRAVAQLSTVWADFLNQQVQAQLQASMGQWRQVQAQWLQQQQAFESTLSTLPVRPPLTVGPQASVREALQAMHDAKVGSVLVTQGTQASDVLGILTRDDVISRIVLPALDLNGPVTQVMSSPVRMLPDHQTLNDAAVLMGQSRIRHVPVLHEGRLHSMVSERDLFTLQRFSSRHISSQIAQAQTLGGFQQAARDIRSFTRLLLGQGVQALQLTRIISQLNDVLTCRLVTWHAQHSGLDLSRACWVALGSEGRGEQTISTDQDNAWILSDQVTADERRRFLAMARRVNEDLDACGYPLCKGGIMASNEACALSRSEWAQRFHDWVTHARPSDLLRSSVFFDMRGVAGAIEWADATLSEAWGRVPLHPLFMRALAETHRQFSLPLNWLGGLRGQGTSGHIDLKLQGTAVVVDAARILALGTGVCQVSTRERLRLAGARLGVPTDETESWVGAFDYLQMKRLNHQLNAPDPTQAGNLIELDGLALYDRRVLRETYRALEGLRQRVDMTWGR